jgi:arylsulfatase A
MRVVFFLIILFFTGHRLEAQTNKPNIVFILSDDLSFRDLSCYGQTNYQTPHIDQLMQSATRFTQAYAAAAECAPSRGCLLTGLHAGRSPIRNNQSARGEEYLPKNCVTFPKILQQQGYTTAIIGKWGLGYADTEGSPLQQGFNYQYGYLSHYEAHSYFPDQLFENGKAVILPENKGFDMAGIYDKERKIGNFDLSTRYNDAGQCKELTEKKRVYASDIFDEKASTFLGNQDKNKPFFLYFTTNLPHGPTIVDDFRQLKDRKDMDMISKEWGAMVQRLDISVGKIIQKLKDLNLYDNTLIVFASDNGYAMHNAKTIDGKKVWQDDPFLHNKGSFWGGKFTVREAGVRIPFFIKAPQQTQSRTVSTPVWLIDLFPTLIAQSGYKKPLATDGHNLTSILRGGKNDILNERFFYFFKQNEQAVRWGSWYAFRENPKDPLHLYLPEEDQTGERNLAAFYPDVVKKIEQYLSKVHEPHAWFWNPGDTPADYEKKKALAKQTNQLIPNYRPNGMVKMPWE